MKVPDLNGRTSAADEVNRTYVGDVTHLPLVDGTFRYFATVIDLGSRRLAGWAIADPKRADLVVDALKAAERTRGSLAGTVMHTDPGAQYRSDSSKRLPRPQSVHSPQRSWGAHHGAQIRVPVQR
ncbi:DDE-type integrase/transposase/recombinase [Streptomyces olivaceoviridis]|uniref:DDE-type integrase/transposase/recombinase n=1 Tax=Streptomyces olivaceoviridis TaxID=1921 RepID=UPI0037B6E249